MSLSGSGTGTGRAVFQSCFERHLVFVLVCFTTPCDWLAKLAPLSQPMRTKTNRDSLALVFPRLIRFHASSTNSDWFIVLFTSVV